MAAQPCSCEVSQLSIAFFVLYQPFARGLSQEQAYQACRFQAIQGIHRVVDASQLERSHFGRATSLAENLQGELLALYGGHPKLNFLRGHTGCCGYSGLAGPDIACVQRSSSHQVAKRVHRCSSSWAESGPADLKDFGSVEAAQRSCM